MVLQIGCEIEAGRRQIIDLTDAAGADEERTMFSIKSDGTVNLIMASANVVANANTDTALCIGTSIANPCIIKTALGRPRRFFSSYGIIKGRSDL